MTDKNELELTPEEIKTENTGFGMCPLCELHHGAYEQVILASPSICRLCAGDIVTKIKVLFTKKNRKAQLATVQKARLDNKELREKIAQILFTFDMNATVASSKHTPHPKQWGDCDVREPYYEWADELLALCDVEEAKKDGYKKGVEDANKYEQMDVEEAKKQERERVRTALERLPLGLQHHYGVDHYDDKGNEVMEHQPDCLRCRWDKVWQALD